MSEKNDKFHELAKKRVETINNAVRILGNLHPASYEWTPAEVQEYFGQIHGALDEAMARFKETKRWRMAEPQAEVEAATTDPISENHNVDIRPRTEVERADTSEEVVAEPAIAEVAKPAPGVPRNHPRNLTIAQILTECANGEREMLAEMIILQRRVIYDQAHRLGEMPSYPTVPAAA